MGLQGLFPHRTRAGRWRGFYKTGVAPGNDGYGETDQLNTAATLTWTLDNFTIKSITSYSDIDDEFGFDLTAGGSELSGGIVPVPFLIRSDSNNKTITQEINISGDALEDTLQLDGWRVLHE